MCRRWRENGAPRGGSRPGWRLDVAMRKKRNSDGVVGLQALRERQRLRIEIRVAELVALRESREDRLGGLVAGRGADLVLNAAGGRRVPVQAERLVGGHE